MKRRRKEEAVKWADCQNCTSNLRLQPALKILALLSGHRSRSCLQHHLGCPPRHMKPTVLTEHSAPNLKQTTQLLRLVHIWQMSKGRLIRCCSLHKNSTASKTCSSGLQAPPSKSVLRNISRGGSSTHYLRALLATFHITLPTEHIRWGNQRICG